MTKSECIKEVAQARKFLNHTLPAEIEGIPDCDIVGFAQLVFDVLQKYKASE